VDEPRRTEEAIARPAVDDARLPMLTHLTDDLDAGKGEDMITNATKAKLLRGEPAYGLALGLGSPRAAEILTRSGADFVLLDTQHGSFGPDSTIETLAAISTGAATPMARVARNDYTMIGRLLDEGCLGVVVPMVHTAADARAAADACRFPPRGTRSWGWGRASIYGDDYPQTVDDQMLVMVQIESAEAVTNAEAILGTPGVDGCWVGPGDLSLSLGVQPADAWTDERVLRAFERVTEACRNTGAIPGFAGNGIEQTRRLVDLGFRYITVASDVGYVISGARATVAALAGTTRA
jgi:4-hydroxy-2-oxoheptanedioate aldolase